MDEEWYKIAEFPNYTISSEGRVRNETRGWIIKTSTTKQGAVKVGLVDSEHRQCTRSVKILVAEAFVIGRSDIFDTPMHLDGDQSNNSASNLVWRPRWFAWKYARQFEHMHEYENAGPIVDRNTGFVYQNIVDASLKNGILFYEVSLALVEKVPVFPTWHLFDWVRSED